MVAVTISLPAQTAPSAPVAAGMKQLKDHVAEAWKSLTPSGRLPASSELRLALSLPLRNPEELSAMLVDVYDPASANFHHYLTPEEFTARFGATATDYEAVANYATTNGLRVIEQHSNRLVLDVAGPVANIEQAFHVALRTYHHPQEARDFYAPDVEPTVSAQLPLLQVSGLNNYAMRMGRG